MHRSVLRGIILILIAVAVVVALLLIPAQKTGRKASHPPNDDPWVLVNYDPDDPIGTYLGNGFISTRIKGDGVGSQNGKPLSCYMAGLYDEEKLIPIPTWSDLRFYDGRKQFKVDKDADYKQTLDMRTGIFTTYATWRAGDKTLKGKIEVIVSRAMPNVGLVQARVVPDFSGDFYIEAPLTGIDRGLRATRDFRNDDGSAVTRVFRSRSSGIYLTYNGKLCIDRPSGTGRHPWPVACEYASAGKPANIRLCVSLASGASDYEASQTSINALPPSRGSAVPGVVQPHKSAWAKLWERDIIVDGPRKDQQAIHSCMFYLLQSVREGSQWSIPPMGLSSADFGGHVFWDADVWMFPALILQHPELAKSIVDYRYNTLPGAMANAKADGYQGAQYAWESGYTGREATPEGLDYRHERHINGDVALAQWQYYLATGDLEWLKTRGYPVIKATADYWLSRVKLNPEKKSYEILRVVPPDENAGIVDNSVYTNAIAKMNLEIAASAAMATGNSPNPKWREVASGMYIPFDAKAKRFIAHDGYKGDQAKQADVELLIYPLQFMYSALDMTDIYKRTFRYYAPRAMANGPAMTSSVHSVIAARLGDCDRAYSDFRKSYQPFLRGPFNYFNEKRSQTWEAYCFLTGAAGPIQAAIFGIGGMRFNYLMAFFADGPIQKLHYTPIVPDLRPRPCLPRQWKSLKITGVQWRGKTFDVEVTRGNKVKMVPR